MGFNGVTMITQTIRQRLNNASPNEVIYVPSGSHNVHSVTIKVPITLIGVGNVEFYNGGGDSNARAFRFTGSGRFHVANISFRAGYRRTIELYPGYRTPSAPSESIRVENCRFDGCETAVKGSYNADPDVIRPTDTIDLRNLSITNTTDKSIQMMVPAKRVTVKDVCIDGAVDLGIQIGVPFPRCPDPAVAWPNIVVQNCHVANVVNGSNIRMYGITLIGGRVSVLNTELMNNRITNGDPGGTSNYAGIYTKARYIQVADCYFNRSAGVILKADARVRSGRGIVHGNVFVSDLDASQDREVYANRWGVQAMSTTSSFIHGYGNYIEGMEVTLGSYADRSIIRDNVFRKTPLVRHWGHEARTGITFEAPTRDYHDVYDNDFDPESTDANVYWHSE